MYVLIIVKNMFHYFILTWHIHEELMDQDAKTASDNDRTLQTESTTKDPLDTSQFFPATIAARKIIKEFKDNNIDRLVDLIFKRFEEDDTTDSFTSASSAVRQMETIFDENCNHEITIRDI